ncbi:uncharacterized protein H6S33_002225 [Morchella sextelata]|uniref:uncharacterized protein n=1 Tax=Morchella sextelata TaxID=1174677 RepID=UPI001D046ED5|nr:uncharacterized protein H6S33_002225 [Morchella sextelata]KAH0608173.1 hypothetical protein H6S33_002225 [Morchella sextelata]
MPIMEIHHSHEHALDEIHPFPSNQGLVLAGAVQQIGTFVLPQGSHISITHRGQEYQRQNRQQIVVHTTLPRGYTPTGNSELLQQPQAQAQAQIDRTRAQIADVQAQAALTQAHTTLTHAQTSLTHAQTSLAHAQSARHRAQIQAQDHPSTIIVVRGHSTHQGQNHLQARVESRYSPGPILYEVSQPHVTNSCQNCDGICYVIL